MNNKKLLISLGIFLLITYSKRFWLGALDSTAFWVADIVCYVVIPSVLIYWMTSGQISSKKFDEDHVNASNGTIAFQALVCTLTLLAMNPIGHLIGIKLSDSYPKLLESTLDYGLKLSKVSEYKYVVLLYFALTSSIVEEFFFRGLIRKILINHFDKSRLAFVIISSIIFGGAHWAAGIAAVVSAGFSGIFLAVLYVWSRDLRPIMIGHFIFNLIMFSRY